MSEKRPRGRPRKPKPEPEPAPAPDVIQVAANRSTQIKKILGIATAVAGVVAAGATAYSKIEKARGNRLDEERANLLIARQRELEIRAELARAKMENSRMEAEAQAELARAKMENNRVEVEARAELARAKMENSRVQVLPHLVKAGVIALTYAAMKPATAPAPQTGFQKGAARTHEEIGEWAGYFTVIPEAVESVYGTAKTMYSYIPKGTEKPKPSKKSAEREMRDYYMYETKQPAYLRSTAQKVAGRHVPDYSNFTIEYDPQIQIPANKTSMWETVRNTMKLVNEELSVNYA